MTKSLIKFLLLTCLFFQAGLPNCWAQANKTFLAIVNKYHYKFENTKEVKDLDSISVIFPYRQRPLQLLYSQISIAKDYALGYGILPYSEGPSELPPARETYFINHIYSEVDSSINKIYFLQKRELRLLNADEGVIYDLIPLEKPYHKFGKCKVLKIFRENLGSATIYYFYNTGSEENIRESMKSTFGILKFKRGTVKAAQFPAPTD